VRFVPVLRRERAAGRMPQAAVTVLAAWVAHLRGAGTAVRDVRADELVAQAQGPLSEVVPRVLASLGADLGDDAELARAVRSAVPGR